MLSLLRRKEAAGWDVVEMVVWTSGWQCEWFTWNFWIFVLNFREKLGIFNINFIFYGVNLQFNIKWNSKKKNIICFF